MIKGIDISHWNKKDTIDKYCTDHDFIIMKATEGKNFKDDALEEHYRKSKWYGLLRGYYHFARPDLGNSAEAEARNYLETIPEKQALHALDVEGMAVMMDDIDSWSERWMKYVEAHTGIKPVLYTSQSQVYKFNRVCSNNNGLWVARYNLFVGSIKPWKHWAIWQYTSNPIDKNKFNGNINQFMRYQGKEI